MNSLLEEFFDSPMPDPIDPQQALQQQAQLQQAQQQQAQQAQQAQHKAKRVKRAKIQDEPAQNVQTTQAPPNVSLPEISQTPVAAQLHMPLATQDIAVQTEPGFVSILIFVVYMYVKMHFIEEYKPWVCM